VLGALLGAGMAALAVRLRDRELLSPAFDGWLAIAAVLVIYGVVELLGGYGFLAAFLGGLGFRRYERNHEYNERVHAGAEVVEKFGELAVVLLLASTITFGGLGEPGLAGWVFVPVALLLIRPVSVLLSLIGTRLPRRERLFVAWFGIRGVGSLYYAAVIVGLGVLDDGEARTVYWTAALCIVVSIVVHGISAVPLRRRWLRR
jgi:NhaP-type Na+/H+ or K+/H+ antiporter